MGSTVELTDVLLVVSNNDMRVGQPLVAGARVVAEVVEHGRDDKVIVFKYKAKTRYRRKRGHRQEYTRLAIRHILTGDEPRQVGAKPARRPSARATAKAAARPKTTARAKKAQASKPTKAKTQKQRGRE